jgi:hypothetical protein
MQNYQKISAYHSFILKLRMKSYLRLIITRVPVWIVDTQSIPRLLERDLVAKIRTEPL